MHFNVGLGWVGLGWVGLDRSAKKILNPFPSAHACRIRVRNVFGTVIAGHCLTATLVGRIRWTGTTQIFFRGLHDAF